MTEPSQYFKGRTVQEQMNEVIGYVDVRSAEVATDAIASDVAQVHQDMLDADADATAAAASAAAAAGTLANAVKKTGEASQSIAGDIAVAGTLSGGVVTGTVITAPTPVNNTDAATKKYVDDHHDTTKINITDINQYAVGLTGNQAFAGEKTVNGMFIHPVQKHDFYISSSYCCLLEYSGRVQVMFDLYTYKGTGSGTIDTVTSSEARGGVTLLDPTGWWTSSTNEFFVLLNANTGKYEVWAHSTTAVSILIRAIRTYGTPRDYNYVTFHDGSTQSTDPRTDTATYPSSEVQIPIMTVRGV